jgi:hypothetical protein
MSYTGTGTTGNVETAKAAGNLPNFQASAGSVTGSWTPQLVLGSTAGITYSTQQGEYTVVGNMVFYTCNIVLTSKGVTTGGGFIQGLPFTVGGVGCDFAVGYYNNFTFIPGYTTLSFFANSGGTTITFNQSNPTTGFTTAINDSNFTNTTNLNFSGFYFTS